MPKALWNGVMIAESDVFEEVEGNIYFPPGAVRAEFFRPSETHTTCPWKGVASYFDIVVDGSVNNDGAWYYPTPKKAAENIKNHVAFWRGVTVQR
jgi:uncharacterized protein (DUF427 family)